MAKKNSNSKAADIMDVLTAVGGAVGGQVVTRIVANKLPDIPPIVINAAPGAIGYFLPSFTNAGWAKWAGIGLMVGSGVSLTRQLAPNLISGIAGMAGTSAIAGYKNALEQSRAYNETGLVAGKPSMVAGCDISMEELLERA